MQNIPLLTKSEENLKSAYALIQKAYYTSSVHCAYYACYQVVMIILKNTTTQNQINNPNSHKETIKTLIEYLENKGCKVKTTRKIKEKLYYLKKCRTQADYDNHFFDACEAEKVYFCAKSVKKLLEKFYRNTECI